MVTVVEALFIRLPLPSGYRWEGLGAWVPGHHDFRHSMVLHPILFLEAMLTARRDYKHHNLLPTMTVQCVCAGSNM